MDLITIILIINFFVIFASFFIFILVVSWKDIYLSIKRFILRKGCDIYMMNTNRNLEHYYMVPKEGIFKIKKLPYITNPEKTANLSEVNKNRIADSITKTNAKLKARILEVETKIKLLIEQIKGIKDETSKAYFNAEIQRLTNIKKSFEAKLESRNESYYSNRRAAYIYIEGDPVPKDMFEFYSAVDNKILDNILSRKISETPENQKENEKHIKFIKIMAIGAAAAAGAAAYLAFMNQSHILTVCRHLGAGC